MSLIELLVYIVLVSSFLVGSIFSAYSMLMSISHDTDQIDTNADVVIETRDETQAGFVALFSSLIIGSALLLMAVVMSEKMSALYDSVLRSEYRLVVRYRAAACLDRALLRLAQDYFYNAGDYISELDCRIEKVDGVPAAMWTIVTSAIYQGIHGRAEAGVEFNPHEIHILYQKFIVF